MVVDQMQRPIGRIGPVRAGYLCYQKGPKLVAVETETGRELWERLDLPKDATVLGDDHRVFIWREPDMLEVFSAVDGRKLEERVCGRSPSKMIHHRGSLVWTVSREKDKEKEVRTEQYDLLTDRSVWAHSDILNSQVAVLDTETLAVATPDGQLQILAARTGEPLCAPLTVDCQKLNGIVAWKDLERWYIAVTRPTGSVSRLRSNQPNDGYRLRFVSGTLYAVDRDEPKILWERKLQDEPIQMDQSVVAPVLIQLWKLVPKDDRSPIEGMLRLTDKRTGKMLVDPNRRHEDLQTFFLLNPDPQQGIVELKLARKTIRLTYASDQPADAVEAIEKSKQN
jgi:outer membrane protein assembly factor BamB